VLERTDRLHELLQATERLGVEFAQGYLFGRPEPITH